MNVSNQLLHALISQGSSSSDKVGDEEGLILLENHAILNHLLLIEVVPSAVGTLLAIAAILQDPVSFFVLDRALHLGNQLVVNANVAVGRAAYNELLLFVLADTIKIVREIKYLHHVWVL